MIELETLADNLLANFRTIRIPGETLPSHDKPPTTGWFASVRAKRVDKLLVYDRRNAVRDAVLRRGHKLFICLEADPEGGWRVHVFVCCKTAAALVDEVGGENCGVGDPVDFDPQELILNRLAELAILNRDDS